MANDEPSEFCDKCRQTMGFRPVAMITDGVKPVMPVMVKCSHTKATFYNDVEKEYADTPVPLPVQKSRKNHLTLVQNTGKNFVEGRENSNKPVLSLVKNDGDF